jgi:hypothetical protein
MLHNVSEFISKAVFASGGLGIEELLLTAAAAGRSSAEAHSESLPFAAIVAIALDEEAAKLVACNTIEKLQEAAKLVLKKTTEFLLDKFPNTTAMIGEINAALEKNAIDISSVLGDPIEIGGFKTTHYFSRNYAEFLVDAKGDLAGIDQSGPPFPGSLELISAAVMESMTVKKKVFDDLERGVLYAATAKEKGIITGSYMGSAGRVGVSGFLGCYKKRTDERNASIYKTKGVGDSGFSIFVASLIDKVDKRELTHEDVEIEVRLVGLEAPQSKQGGALGGIRAALLYGEQIAIAEGWPYVTNLNRTHVSFSITGGFTSESGRDAGATGWCLPSAPTVFVDKGTPGAVAMQNAASVKTDTGWCLPSAPTVFVDKGTPGAVAMQNAASVKGKIDQLAPDGRTESGGRGRRSLTTGS